VRYSFARLPSGQPFWEILSCSPELYNRSLNSSDRFAEASRPKDGKKRRGQEARPRQAYTAKVQDHRNLYSALTI